MSTPRRALIVIDVQQEYFDGILQVQYPPREESLRNILSALDGEPIRQNVINPDVLG